MLVSLFLITLNFHNIIAFWKQSRAIDHTKK